MVELSKRQKQILEYMKKGVMYSTDELVVAVGLKGPRTRQQTTSYRGLSANGICGTERVCRSVRLR